MGIVEEDIGRARESVDIVDIISQHVQLKRVGRRWVGLCPFHPERSPSFSVNQELGLYYCFGCGAKGDAISFLRNAEHLDFVTAVEKLASRGGVELRYTDSTDQDFWKKKNELFDALKKASDFFHEQLLTDPAAGPARAYLRERGFTSDEVRRYMLGWAPVNTPLLTTTLGITEEAAIETSLCVKADSGKLKNFFSERIMFPIFSPTSQVLGFGGRHLPEGTGPKYKNSASTPVYDKSKVLYGLNWAKEDIVRKNQVIICEGYVDVVGFAYAGCFNAVATCGTALTEEHIKILTNYTANIVLAFDADSAGQAAAERLYVWEKKYGLNLTVVGMPEGTDPGELARTQPQLLVDAVDAATPFLKFRVRQALASHQLATVEGRVRAAEHALSIISEHPDLLVRDQYILDLSEQLGLEPDELRRRATTARRPDKVTSSSAQEGDERERVLDASALGLTEESPELEALRVMLENPVHRPLFHATLFRNRSCRAVYEQLEANEWDISNLDETFDAPVASFIQRLAVQESKTDAVELMQRLVEVASQQELANLAEEAKTADGDRLIAIAETTRWLKSEMEELNTPEGAVDAVPNIFEWLIEIHEKHPQENKAEI